MNAEAAVEIAVVGAGPAGCSAALMAKSLGLPVCVFEAHRVGGQLASIAHQIHNLAGWDASGEALATKLEGQLEAYSIPICRTEVISVTWQSPSWTVETADRRVVTARFLVGATGAREVTLMEHKEVRGVQSGYQDKYLYQVSLPELKGKRCLVIGSDRPLLTVARARPEDLAAVAVTVLALPEKRYVLNGYTGPTPFARIDAEVVDKLEWQPNGVARVEYRDAQGFKHQEYADEVITCLGKRPNVDLFVHLQGANEDGYLAPRNETLRDLRFMPVGDLAHKGFQRIAVAMGDGAGAILRWFYEREQLYGLEP